MLPKPHRIPSSDVRHVMRRGRRYDVGDISCRISQNDTARFRLAIIISSKVDKRATRRNRMRRLMSESVQHLLPRLKGGYDVVFMPKRGLPDEQEVVNEIVQHVFLRSDLLVLEKQG